MDSNVFDVFQSIKTLLYLGNYQTSSEEASDLDINEEDVSQIVKKYFYYFINCVEDQKTEDLNNFLASLKDMKDDQIKIYYNLFLFFTIYIYKNQFNEQRFSKLFNDLKNVKKYDPVIFPAIYIISLMLLERNENENFFQLIEKFEQDMEILLLKFYLFFKLNKVEEMQKTLNMMNMKEPDSILTQICEILFKLHRNNDFEYAISSLQIINKNHKITPKIFNFIGASLMSKGAFEEASKALTFGKDSSEKSGIATKDLNCILVNLICCYRNLNRQDEVRNYEEVLRKNDPKNLYFSKIASFEEEFTKAIS